MANAYMQRGISTSNHGDANQVTKYQLTLGIVEKDIFCRQGYG